MNDARGALLFWLAAGVIGFALIPWYALPDSVWTLAWVGQLASREAAPALLQSTAHGRAWLAPLGVLLLSAAALLAPAIGRGLRARALLALGADRDPVAVRAGLRDRPDRLAVRMAATAVRPARGRAAWNGARRIPGRDGVHHDARPRARRPRPVQGRRLRRRQRGRDRAAARSVHVLSGGADPRRRGRERRRRVLGIGAADAPVHRKGVGRGLRRRGGALRRGVEHAAAGARCARPRARRSASRAR